MNKNPLKQAKLTMKHFALFKRKYNSQGLCTSFKISSTYIYIESINYKNRFKKPSTLSYASIFNGLYRRYDFTKKGPQKLYIH